jgi:hypothetical protein
MYSFLAGTAVKRSSWNILKDRLFPIINVVASGGPGQQVLGTLEDEIPTEVGKTYQNFAGSLTYLGWSKCNLHAVSGVFSPAWLIFGRA